ncbi:hypothetical protein [Companilactobacillus bobalius]|uniref:Uncharacterized protein n=1 Tax=Companilactobacillus bobalius TaxID=2801451 RepID=A0A202FGC0_9LACO|nr:hypothetical protein [Companilactobacillus bobalius]OVE99503.1 hypothetical protein LKACC16343_00616 [Companilactobacillus bobalius]GEO57486.1 hypothetical protein LBO01_06150 [Companilactobacillus paralimentarius]
MKKTYQGKNTIMTFEINKPTKWYQWLVIALFIVGIIYLVVK